MRKSGGQAEVQAEVQAEGTAYAKALGRDSAWCLRGTARSSMWLEQSEGESGRR